jgi:hypothetical protein
MDTLAIIGTGIAGRRNLLNAKFWKMLLTINRFNQRLLQFPGARKS